MNTVLCDGISWVGYVDWTVRDFHGYVTSRGATYNSYLVCDEKTALIDGVKAPFVNRLLTNVSALTGLSSVDYVICNHAEPDHSGGLAQIMAAMPRAILVCTAKCAAVLGSYHNTSDWNIQTVKSGDTISLGKRTLTFIETPMVHWPESMFTYVPEDKLLFSMDAFGQHYASAHRFDDEVDLSEVMTEAKKYYASIVMLYGRQIAKVLEAAGGLDIEMIAPSHGVIWRSRVGEIISAYKEWVICKPRPKVLVLYDSMWNSTKRMAEAIVDGASIDGVDAQLIYVRAIGLADIAAEVLDAAAIAVGSATLNMGMMPTMGAVMTFLKGLRPVGKAGFAFGSYGWSKGGAEAIDEYLRGMKVDVLRDPLKCKWRPDDGVLGECRAAGGSLAEKALALAADSEDVC